MTQSELTALIQQAMAQDPQAQERLIQDIQNRVYYHCRKMLKNEEDALDATQDVLITVITNLHKLRDAAAFYGWVNAITANRCKHLLTQGVTEWQIPENEDGNSMLDNLEELNQQAIPEEALDNEETQRLIMEIIDALPPAQRMSVLFYYYDEMSIREIAAAMETSEGTVKSRLNYARKAIKAGVEDLEKRGTKLYGMAPLPLLLYFLRREAAHSSLSAAQSAKLTSASLYYAKAKSAEALYSAQSAAGTSAAAHSVTGTAATAAAAKTGAAVSVKILAGVLAAAVVTGSAFGVTKFVNNRSNLASETSAEAAESLFSSGDALSAEVLPTAEESPLLQESGSTPEEIPAIPEVPASPETLAPQEDDSSASYASVYAQMVQTLESLGNADSMPYSYDLVYIDGDDIPELIASYEAGFFNVSIYSVYPDGSLRIMAERITGNPTAPTYIPKCNLIGNLSRTMLGEYWSTYQQINDANELEFVYERYENMQTGEISTSGTLPDGINLENAQSLLGTMTAQEILAQLGAE